MSTKTDQLATIKLTPQNQTAIDDYRNATTFKPSRNKVANVAIEFGIQQLRLQQKGRK